MKIRMVKDFSIAHDGINVTHYEEGAELDIDEPKAKRLLECGAACEVTRKAVNPVMENKAANPIEEDKAPAKRRGRKKKAD